MPLERLEPRNHLSQNSQGHKVQAAAMLPCDPQNTKALQENAEPKLRIHKVSWSVRVRDSTMNEKADLGKIHLNAPPLSNQDVGRKSLLWRYLHKQKPWPVLDSPFYCSNVSTLFGIRNESKSLNSYYCWCFRPPFWSRSPLRWIENTMRILQ